MPPQAPALAKAGGLFPEPPILLDKVANAGVDKPHGPYSWDIAEVAELVDALGSGSSGCTPVRVQVPASAPKEIKGLAREVFSPAPFSLFFSLFSNGFLTGC